MVLSPHSPKGSLAKFFLFVLLMLLLHNSPTCGQRTPSRMCYRGQENGLISLDQPSLSTSENPLTPYSFLLLTLPPPKRCNYSSADESEGWRKSCTFSQAFCPLSLHTLIPVPTYSSVRGRCSIGCSTVLYY